MNTGCKEVQDKKWTDSAAGVPVSSPHCTDNVTLNDFNLILNNLSLNNQGSNHMIKCDMCKPSTTSGIIKVISINCCSLRSSSR